MGTKKTIHLSLRLDRESYFTITNGPNSLTSKLDRDQSWVINRAVSIGLLALGAGLPTVTGDEKLKAALMAQGERLRTLETARVEIKDREPLAVEAGT